MNPDAPTSAERPWCGLVVPVVLVAAAEAAARGIGITSDALAAPSAVALAGYEALTDGSLVTATFATLASALTGLALGGAIGLALGLAFGLVPVLDRLAELTVEAVRPVPSIALVPVALLAFGFGYRLEIAVVAFAGIWPVMVLSRAAIRGIEPCLLEVARALRLSARARVVEIVLPAILPSLFVAFRLGAGIALIVAVTVEISANPLGLGHAMMQAQQSLRPDLMLAYLVWIGTVGFAVNAGLHQIERRLFGRTVGRRR